ncbi:MAG: hypothetical protein HRT47_12615 [Candidatus Caenarcaniphilales bacterium]|nr:hypothetical protein [Candidatus Caenarcaniphilales bacterium]
MLSKVKQSNIIEIPRKIFNNEILGHFIKAHIFDPKANYFQSNTSDVFYKTDDLMLFGALDLPISLQKLREKLSELEVTEDEINKQESQIIEKTTSEINEKVNNTKTNFIDLFSSNETITLISSLERHFQESKNIKNKDGLLDQLPNSNFSYKNLSECGKTLSFLLKLSVMLKYWNNNFNFTDTSKSFFENTLQNIQKKQDQLIRTGKNINPSLGNRLEKLLNEQSNIMYKNIVDYSLAANNPQSKSYSRENLERLSRISKGIK